MVGRGQDRVDAPEGEGGEGALPGGLVPVVVLGAPEVVGEEVAADGEFVGTLTVGATLELRTVPDAALLALLPEQSLYSHFQERFS